ncbi:23S rRNA (guanosine(2251)-2'-O)-methyltransferase RlmB [Micrococcales bacterium 31B]|nr:23S rRNA (guanosine(2251)-2'-O)-methyltransferase RlmB [Micrococcales bacterium 31B]
MAGNAGRHGAIRKDGTKKGSVVGSGGQRRKALEGRGPTPRAEDRAAHKKGQARAAAVRRRADERSQGRGPVRRGVKRGGNEVVTGRNSVLEALRADIPVTAMHVMLRIDMDERVREALAIAAERKIPLLESTRGDLDRLTEDAIHQGVALSVPPYEYADVDELLEIASQRGQAPLLVALDGVTDPRNLGAVLRSAAAFGAHGVIVPERRSVGMTASAWKVSAGAAARLRVAQVGNLNRALDALKQAGCFVMGLDAGGDTTVAGTRLARDPLVVVVGSEGKGLSRLVREGCDEIASIQMLDETESLNASVAAAITLYEIAQKRQATE